MYVIDGKGRKKRHVVGLAPVSGMCNSLNSCTISEGTSFQTVLVAGHEMGHRYECKIIASELYNLNFFFQLSTQFTFSALDIYIYVHVYAL